MGWPNLVRRWRRRKPCSPRRTHNPRPMRSLILQMARLGDLVQTLPAIMALKTRNPDETLDLLCASPLAGLASVFPGINRVVPWEPDRWQQWAQRWPDTPGVILETAHSYVGGLASS